MDVWIALRGLQLLRRQEDARQCRARGAHVGCIGRNRVHIHPDAFPSLEIHPDDAGDVVWLDGVDQSSESITGSQVSLISQVSCCLSWS